MVDRIGNDINISGEFENALFMKVLMLYQTELQQKL